MSADNWGVCPRCSVELEKQRLARVKAADDAYGKVESLEYLNLLEQANEEILPEYILREDYEIWTDENGKFFVSYKCRCDKCGFSHVFRYDEQLKV